MKNINIILLIAFLLSACAPVTTAVPTLTSTPTKTATLTSTRTPTPTSTPTPTPEVGKDFETFDIENWHSPDAYLEPEDYQAYADSRLAELKDVSLPEPNPEKMVAISDSAEDHSFFYLSKTHGNTVIPQADRPFFIDDKFRYTELVVKEKGGAEYRVTYAVSTIIMSVPGEPGKKVSIPVVVWIPNEFWEDKSFAEERLNLWLRSGKLFLAVIDDAHTPNLSQIVDLNKESSPNGEQDMEAFCDDLNPRHIEGIIFEALPLQHPK